MTPDANDLCVFAVKRGYIESKEIYCNPLYPTYLSLVEKYQHSPYANGILNNHVAVNPKTDCSLLSDSSEVSFVPMANVQEKTNVVSYDMVAYETVKKGYAIGEILFGLDYLAAKGQAPSAEKQTTAEIWSYIHPLIQKSFNFPESSVSLWAGLVQFEDTPSTMKSFDFSLLHLRSGILIPIGRADSLKIRFILPRRANKANFR